MRGAILCLVVMLAGCTVRNQQQTVVPTPPAPAAAPQPAAEAPFSIAQTSVRLPPPQPVNPDAIPAAPVEQPPAPEKAEQTPAPKPPRRVVTTPKPEPEQPAAPTTPAPATSQQDKQPAIQPILNAEEQKRLQDAILARRHEIDDVLARTKGHLSAHDKTLVERIHSFLELSDNAEKRGDYTQADALSERALILARELPGQ
jgi:outer membrane biosynthesis protein TonB